MTNELVGDRGLHCFNVPWFNRCFPHKIKLNCIHRQSDIALIKCINALEKGNVSDEDVAFINSLSRKIVFIFFPEILTWIYIITQMYRLLQVN